MPRDAAAVIVVTPEELEAIVERAVRRALEAAGHEPPSARLLKPEEAGDRLGVTKTTILKWARKKGLPHRRLGDREVRFVEAEILEWNTARKKAS